MIALETTHDELLKCNYTLYSVKFLELQTLVKSWYTEYDLSEFDNQYINERFEVDSKVERKAALISNFFYAYKEGDKFYLLDGFRRLLTNYGNLDIDTTAYIKIIEDTLDDNQITSLMFNLNLWKLYHKNYGGFSLKDFLDRGFRLLLKSKFDISLYSDKNTRNRSNDDISVLEYYFINEHDFSNAFKYDYKYVATLFLNKNIIGDFKDILNANNYLVAPFPHYNMFLNGYATFLSNKRLNHDNTDYKFEYFLNALYKDAKFFKKLKGMSGTDSTRKNIFDFYRNLNITN